MNPSDEEVQKPAIQQFGQYQIVRQIGQGAMGVVYEAIQVGLGRRVALKVLPTHLAQDRTFAKRFRNEASAAARINHPNIATIYDYGELESGPFMAMEYIQGRTLEGILNTEGLTHKKALEISEKLAEALTFAHDEGIIHRDIKSANVMLDTSGRPIILDFGLAKIQNATLLTLDGTIMGTPAYMAPEQARSDPDLPMSPRVDIYSLGVLMYEMFTGQLPFKGPTHMVVLKKVLEEDPIPPRRLDPKIPKDLQVIILKAMEKDLRHRYGSIRALAEDLRRFRLGEPILARPTRLWVKVYRKSRKFRGVFWALGLTFLVALGWTAFLLAQHRRAQAEYKKILSEAQSRLFWVEGEREVLLEKLSEDPIFRVLESRDPLMRAQAIIALNQKLRERALKGQLEKESFNLTLKALDDPHPLVRRHAAILLGILKDGRALQALLARVGDEDAEVRKHAILALGLLQNPEGIPKILGSLKDENEDVRANAALSLGLLHATEAMDALIQISQDPFPKVRSNAAASLGSMKDSKVIPSLIKLLKDPVDEVRQSAQDALSNFGEASRVPVMVAIFEDTQADPKEIVRRLRGIEPDRDQAVLESVIKLLNHSNPDVRYTTVLVLGLFQRPEVVPFLIEALKDTEASVRDNVRLALIGLTGEDFGFDQAKWRHWWKKQKRS